MGNKFKLGQTYRDTATINKLDDQFLRWINIEGSRMLNSPGIRPLNFINKKSKFDLPAYVILVTNNKSSSLVENPWEDKVDYANAEIKYWGDAKFSNTKGIDDWNGNKVVRKIFDKSVDKGSSDFATPFLHFSKPKKGEVIFNGLCVLDNLELNWFWDEVEKTPIQNYLMHLRILDCAEVDIDWLHDRAAAHSLKSLDKGSLSPTSWNNYKSGRLRPLKIFKKEIKSPESQLPKNVEDIDFLNGLTKYDPYDFEKIIVGLFTQFGQVVHNISGTKRTRDGGFDFFGEFKLSSILEYKIKFRGEVKKWAIAKTVGPKDISRLVARLKRGEYGIFVTTSTFSKQAQEEVLIDGYPVKLISGIDLVNMFKHLNLITGKSIENNWVKNILTGK